MTKRVSTAAIGLAALCLAACGRGGVSTAKLREPDTASRLHVADAAAEAGQVDIALSMYGAAAQAAPDDVDVQSRYVSLLLQASQQQTAEQVLNRALVLHPRDPALRRWLGVVRLENGSSAEALKIFDDLLARKPRDVAILNGRGMALDLEGQHAEAQQTYRAALAEAPSDVRTSNNLAVSLLLSGQPAAATAILLPLSQQADAPTRVRNNLAVAEAAAGDAASASARLKDNADAGDLRALATALGAPPAFDNGTTAEPPQREIRPAG